MNDILYVVTVIRVSIADLVNCGMAWKTILYQEIWPKKQRFNWTHTRVFHVFLTAAV